jgi:hypothetical protein
VSAGLPSATSGGAPPNSPIGILSLNLVAPHHSGLHKESINDRIGTLRRKTIN